MSVAAKNCIENIPPKGSSQKKPMGFNVGRTTGLCAEIDRLKTMDIGKSIECPMEWEDSLHSAARRKGMVITLRRLGNKDKITVYKIG